MTACVFRTLLRWQRASAAGLWYRRTARGALFVRFFLILLTALLMESCTKKPEGIPLASFRVDYGSWSCRQLKEEADLLHDALAVAAERGPQETVLHLSAAKEEVRRAATAKKCGLV